MFNNGVEFIISNEYKLIIPLLDVSKCNIELFNTNTINEWNLFIKAFDIGFENAIKSLNKKKYKTTTNNNLFIKVPYNYNSCIWDNYPDLYNCSGSQVELYLQKTKSKLSNIYIRTSPFQYLINCKVTPETFQNLSISNYSLLTEILINNGETSSIIWCAIACWWNYSTEPCIQTYTKLVSYGRFGTCTEQQILGKEKNTSILDDNNSNILIKILNEYCCPKIYDRCNWFMILHARAKINSMFEVLSWINNNKDNVNWDEDLISDTPNFAFNECYEEYDKNPVILNEIGKRFIN